MEKIIKAGEVCLSIGGDHSMSVGTIHGHLKAQPDTVLVWVDAHADINPPLASQSGNFHGMVLSFLLHELQDYIPQMPIFDWLKPWYCVLLILSLISLLYMDVRHFIQLIFAWASAACCKIIV